MCDLKISGVGLKLACGTLNTGATRCNGSVSISFNQISDASRYLIGVGLTLGLIDDPISLTDCCHHWARVPFIVRENLGMGKYTLVGEAFAENFMRGEVQSLNFAD